MGYLFLNSYFLALLIVLRQDLTASICALPHDGLLCCRSISVALGEVWRRGLSVGPHSAHAHQVRPLCTTSCCTCHTVAAQVLCVPSENFVRTVKVLCVPSEDFVRTVKEFCAYRQSFVRTVKKSLCVPSKLCAYRQTPLCVPSKLCAYRQSFVRTVRELCAYRQRILCVPSSCHKIELGFG